MAQARRDQRPSEYGGRPGLVQPAPHVPRAREILSQLARTDPAEPTSGVEIIDRVERA